MMNLKLNRMVSARNFELFLIQFDHIFSFTDNIFSTSLSNIEGTCQESEDKTGEEPED